MILYRDPSEGTDATPTIIEIVKQDGLRVWYRIIDEKHPSKETVFDCTRDALDSRFYEVSKKELVKRVLKQ